MRINHRPPHIHPDSHPIFITAKIYGGFPHLAPETTKDYFWNLLKDKAQKHKIDLDAQVVLNDHYHLIIRVGDGAVVPKFIRELHGASSHYIRKNIPSLVTEHGQLLIRRDTAWDRRQERRLEQEMGELLQRCGLRREMNFATTEETKSVLAQFIAHHKNRFKPEDYHTLRRAITKGRITDPQVLMLLVSRDTPVWYQYVDRAMRNERDYYTHLNYIHQNPVKHGLAKRLPAYKWSSIRQFIERHGQEWVVDCFRTYPVADFQPEGVVD